MNVQETILYNDKYGCRDLSPATRIGSHDNGFFVYNNKKENLNDLRLIEETVPKPEMVE